MKKRILITGGAGFIGKHLTKALEASGQFERVMVYDLKFGWTITNERQLEEVFEQVRPHVVVHLAAISNSKECRKNPQLALDTNITGTYNALSLAKKYRAYTIVASSAATDEPTLNLYAYTKDCVERMAMMFKNVTIARFFNVYGKGSKSVVNKFIYKIKRGEQITLNGNTTRDYVYVDDVVKSLIHLIDLKEVTDREFVNIGTAKKTKLKTLVKLIEEMTGKSARLVQGPAIFEIQTSWMNKDFGLVGKTSLKEGIRKLL